MTASAAWNWQFDATIASLRFKIGGKSLAIEPTLNLLQDRSAPSARPRREALAGTFKDNIAVVRADHQHARQGQGNIRLLARLRRHRRRSPLVEPGRARGGGCAGRRVRAAYPRLSHRYYALKARWFGKKRLPHWDRNAPLPQVPTRTVGWIEARNTVLTAYGAFSPKMAAHRRALLRRALDRRAGASRQGAGRVRASDHAVGASLRAAQLSGQAARRDDARARTRPRRASGAGRAERRADGADAADARRDRERVRRDADLPQAPRRHARPRKSARRCSPPRSRT